MLEKLSLENKTVVITGGGTGLGKEMCLAMAQAGADLVIAARRLEPIEEVSKLVRGFGRRSLAIPTDATDTSDIKTLFDTVLAAFGKVDVLINNAGTSATNLGLERNSTGVLHAPIDITLDLIRINGLSAASMTRSLLHCLSEGSQVVNITSQIGSMVVGARFDDLPYSTSKAVMNMVTVQLATQLRDKGITVAAFHPGWVRTDMGGSQADISAEESAGGILSATEQLRLEDSGSFLRWDGSTHPW